MLSPRSFGLACGSLAALAVFIIGLVAAYGGFWVEAVDLVGKFYIGYDATLGGSIVGAIWAFVDGLIGGALFAWLYNKFQKQQ